MNSVKIKLNDRQKARCVAFAEARKGDKALYEKRGAFKIEDLIAGAMGEIAVWKYLRARGFSDVTKPDFTIYDKKDKSYDADIMANGKHIHVKSQTRESERRYGPSWIMQRHDPCLKKIQYNHYMVPCVVDIGSNTVEIFGAIGLKQIIEGGHIGELKVPWMRKTKVAIYMETLKELDYNARWRFFTKYSDETVDKRLVKR